jgi:pectate lyase
MEAMFRAGIFGVVMLLVLASWATARDGANPESVKLLDEGLRLAGTLNPSKTQCGVGLERWAGLTVDNQRVIAADMLGEIGGFARDAGVSGGLGGELRVVTSDQDYDSRLGEKAIAGTLRAAVMVGPVGPRWVVFALKPGTVIRLKDSLRLPDNITLDGSCSDVTLEATPRIGLAYVLGSRNVVIARLSFRQSGHIEGKQDPEGRTCIRLNGHVDAVAVMHNDISQCSDGAIDITTSPGKPVPALARITIGYNRISRHDKVMLFGTYTCGSTGRDDEPCDARELEHNRHSAPGLYLTLNNNLFDRTTQRHPRVFGRVMAHVVGNVIAFKSYGTFVSNGARALVEGNVYLATGPKGVPNRAVWTTTTPGAPRTPWDVEGFIRARNNRSLGHAIVGENQPSLVTDPAYREPSMVPRINRLPLPEAIGCIAARAGKQGAAAWPESCH